MNSAEQSCRPSVLVRPSNASHKTNAQASTNGVARESRDTHRMISTLNEALFQLWRVLGYSTC